MDKKGIIFGELGTIIIAIIGCLIIIAIAIAVFAFIIPAVGGFGCGVNIAIKGAILSSTSGVVNPDLLLCNQYKEPVKIDATKFSSCPTIANFCLSAKGPMLDACMQQCARIQIDALTDTCWTMGGGGRYDLRSLLDKIGSTGAIIGKVVSSDFILAALGNQQKLDELIKNDAPLKALVLRCFRFQVTKPIEFSSGAPFNFDDTTYGYTSLYTYDRQSLGGTGVLAVNSSEIDIGQSLKLYYNMSKPAQVCYQSYAQYDSLLGNGRAAVIRSCDSWTGGWVKSFKFLN